MKGLNAVRANGGQVLSVGSAGEEGVSLHSYWKGRGGLECGFLPARVTPPSPPAQQMLYSPSKPTLGPLNYSLGDFFQPITVSNYYLEADAL